MTIREITKDDATTTMKKRVQQVEEKLQIKERNRSTVMMVSQTVVIRID